MCACACASACARVPLYIHYIVCYLWRMHVKYVWLSIFLQYSCHRPSKHAYSQGTRLRGKLLLLILLLTTSPVGSSSAFLLFLFLFPLCLLFLLFQRCCILDPALLLLPQHPHPYLQQQSGREKATSERKQWQTFTTLAMPKPVRTGGADIASVAVEI